MIERPPRQLLTWVVGLLAALAALTAAVLTDVAWLVDLDHRGEGAETWAVDDRGLRQLLLGVEDAFGTIGITVITVVLAIALVAKGHRRAAGFAAGTVLTTSLVTTLLKALTDRDRPVWQHPEELLTNPAFPSGHASSITALGGVVLVLGSMLIRRAQLRRALTGLVVLVALAVYLDRVLLGRHYPSDVVGGALLGAAVVLLGLAVYSPLPRSHAEKSDPLPQAVPSTRRLAVVLNPIKVEDEAVFRETVRSLAVEAGWQEPTWYLTTPEDSGTGQAEQAAVAGADLVIVCGGDGTVREVCAELAGTGIPVGIIPAGTGNLLARNLELPLYLRAAIDVALTGQDRAIDMVRVTGDGELADRPDSHFLVMAGMGFDAAIMEGVNEDIKKRVGWLAYVLSALKSLMFPAVKVELSVDGGEWTKHRARTILVGNVGYLQAGMPLLPDAVIDDGRLDVVLLYPRTFFSWIPLALRVLAKRRRVDDTVNRMTGRTVSIRAAVDTPRQLDGDSIGAGRELHMECLHGRVLVRVPR
ncbi:diacylglycerol kinase family protein [Nocardioides sp.]|uniref:diacylglycerol kinase family protein n=1 Tax=Nocardioides sp. TaxID=35761 RepID=UPI003518D301